MFLTRTSETADELGMSSVALKDYPCGTFNGFSKRLRMKQNCEYEVYPKYMGYFLRSTKFRKQINSMSIASTRASLNIEMINRLTVDLPDIKCQKKIADFLFLIDEKIKNNEAINRNLSEQVATLYKSWFIDFDNNRGICPEDLKDATLGDVAEIVSGKRPPMKQADKTDEVSIPLVGAASIMGYTNEVLYDSKILVVGRVGTHGVVQRFNEECWPSDNTFVITTSRYEFVNQILLNIDYKSMNRGSTQPLITQGDLKKKEIKLPPSNVLDEFEILAGGLMAQHDKNRVENVKLAELRDSLIPKLMSGELDVSDLDI